MFAKLSIQIQIDEVAYTKIQSLLQREKPNEIKAVDNLIKDNFKQLITLEDDMEKPKEITDIKGKHLMKKRNCKSLKSSTKNKNWRITYFLVDKLVKELLDELD